MVCEWIKGGLKVVRKSGHCQLMTNFLLSNPDLGNYPCPRLATLSNYFENTGVPTVEAATRALQLASTGITRYSQVYDLTKGEVYLFSRALFYQSDENQSGCRIGERTAGG